MLTQCLQVLPTVIGFAACFLESLLDSLEGVAIQHASVQNIIK